MAKPRYHRRPIEESPEPAPEYQEGETQEDYNSRKDADEEEAEEARLKQKYGEDGPVTIPFDQENWDPHMGNL